MTTPPSDVQARVEAIVAEMEAGAYGRAKEKLLAAQWGVARSTVRGYAATARLLLAGLGREDGAARIEAIIDDQLRKARGRPDEPAVVAKLIPYLFKLYGLDRPSSGTSGQPPATPATPGERPLPPPGFEDEPDAE